MELETISVVAGTIAALAALVANRSAKRLQYKLDNSESKEIEKAIHCLDANQKEAAILILRSLERRIEQHMSQF